jgi:hypothetical protein
LCKSLGGNWGKKTLRCVKTDRATEGNKRGRSGNS